MNESFKFTDMLVSTVKNTTFFFLLFFNCVHVKAQIISDRPERLYMDRKNMYQGFSDKFYGTVSFHSDVEINSSAVTNSFFKKMLFGGFIDNALKDDVTKRLGANNRLGLDFNVGFTGTYNSGYNTFIAGIGHREHFDCGFMPDVFELLFRGNRNYAGRTADISGSKLSYFNYQSIFFGISRQLASSNYILGAGISIIKGGQYQQIKIQKGLLFTEENGESLDLDLSFDMAYTNQNSSLFPPFRGAGAALNFSIATWQEKWRFNAEIRDVGFIQWNNINTLHADSSYRYTGIEIPSILNYGNYTFYGINADTLREQYNIDKERSNLSRIIPFSIYLNYTYLISQKFNVVIGGKYMANANYIPRIYLRGLYFPSESWVLSPALSYGGYGKFNLEVNVAKSFGDNFLISAGAVFLDYLILPRRSSGLGGQLSLIKVF